jgi:hypothetical protein
MSDELSKSRPSVALPLFPLSFLCLSLMILCLSLTFLCLSLTILCLSLTFLCLYPTFLCLLPFLLCLEKKRLVVWGAASTHRCHEDEEGMETPHGDVVRLVRVTKCPAERHFGETIYPPKCRHVETLLPY